MGKTTLITMADWSTSQAIKSAQKSENEMIKNVGIGVGAILIVLIIVIVLAVRHSKRTPVNQGNNDSALKEQLKELLEQNKKLADKVEKLEQENNKKGKK
ncbi:hypothetical protein IIY68_01070 [Candidatus Saccharibacteria bacterium]|nr:hypothetical protein [Candidatus Saccharibacteria bacterium]